MEHLPCAPFQNLIHSFCQSVGLPAPPEALGLEFEAAGHTVVMAPDARSDERFLLEVWVGGVGELPEGLAMLLHQLNDAARLTHDWVASMGPKHELRLHTQRAVAHTNAGELESLLAEGVERAQALSTLVNALPSASLGKPPPDFDPQAVGMLKA